MFDRPYNGNDEGDVGLLFAILANSVFGLVHGFTCRPAEGGVFLGGIPMIAFLRLRLRLRGD